MMLAAPEKARIFQSFGIDAFDLLRVGREQVDEAQIYAGIQGA